MLRSSRDMQSAETLFKFCMFWCSSVNTIYVDLGIDSLNNLVENHRNFLSVIVDVE